VDIVLSIYPLLITPLVSFKHLLLVAICVVDLPTANYPFGIFKHLLLVDIVLSIYPLFITALVSFKHLLLVAIMLSIYPLLIPLLSLKHLLLVAICVVDLHTANYRFGIL
jgi:hypothetical protein